MEDKNLSPDDLNPTNGNENNNAPQNNSEELTQPENAETKNSSGRRHYRKDNKRLASLKNVKSRKQEKLKRLTDEKDDMKADLQRGYLIISFDNDSSSQRVKHVPLETSDKEMLRSVIAEREYEIYELDLDISEIDMKIREIASAKKTSFKEKLNKIKQEKKENDLVKRVAKELGKADKNGSKEVMNNLKNQLKSGNKNDAYESLKSFLSQEVSPVAKKLNKSEDLEKNVLNRVLDKLEPVQY